MRYKQLVVSLLLLVLLLATAAADAPNYEGHVATEINDGVPTFTYEEIRATEGIQYAALDKWGRASSAIACLGPETLTDAPMYDLLPSGWQTASYDFVPGGSLYQRCHLIAHRLGGEEVIENLLTGTQYLNIVGMLPIGQNRGLHHGDRASRALPCVAVLQGGQPGRIRCADRGHVHRG